MKRILLLTVVFIMMLGTSFSFAQADADNFYKSDWVKVEKVSFSNQYKMKVAGNLFLPKTMKEGEKYPAIIVGHPMGAVKEQSANLYATKMAERGFVTLSIDLSFWGASEGEPRNAVLPEVYAEDFSAAVDFLGTRPFVDRNNIGVIGICGSGSFAISAAKIEPRLKAIATISMYNMGTASRNGLKHALTLEQRKQIMAEAAEQRYAEFLGGETKYTGGTVHEVTENSGPIEREFYEFYRTQRGEFTPEGATPMTTTHPTLSMPEQSLYIIVSGILHTFTTQQGEDKTVRFLSEGDAILCYNTSKHSVKTLTRCVAYYISEDEIEELCATSITFSNLIRQMMEYQFYLKEEMSVNARKLTIRERYLSLLSEIPDILYRVPLKYITYYLGADVTSLGYLAGSCK